jgi:aryl-alcohol dehydrogenase-like predicted oxidoreductase
MSFGTSDQMKWTIPEEQALPILKHAFDRGINTWDTVRPDTIFTNNAARI